MGIIALFDLDGTLLDTIDDIADACNYTLKKWGFPEHPVNPYKHFVGAGVENLLMQALPESARDDATIKRFKIDYEEYYAAHSTDKTRPYPGITDALAALKATGVHLAVLSNKSHRFTQILVQDYFPGMFDTAYVYGLRDGFPPKPDPTAAREILDLFDGNIDKGFYIGDTHVDIETGKNVGLTTIGVLWGFRTRDELEKSGADSIITKPDELVKIIIDNNN